jgi:hypothetical protein
MYSPSFHSVRIDCDIEIDSDVYPLAAQLLQAADKGARSIIAAVKDTNLVPAAWLAVSIIQRQLHQAPAQACS